MNGGTHHGYWSEKSLRGAFVPLVFKKYWYPKGLPRKSRNSRNYCVEFVIYVEELNEEEKISEASAEKNGCPNRACIKIFDVFVSCLTLSTSLYIMHVKFYIHEILTTAGNFIEIFPCQIRMQQACLTYFNFCKIFHVACKVFHGHIQILHAIKILPS